MRLTHTQVSPSPAPLTPACQPQHYGIPESYFFLMILVSAFFSPDGRCQGEVCVKVCKPNELVYNLITNQRQRSYFRLQDRDH